MDSRFEPQTADEYNCLYQLALHDGASFEFTYDMGSTDEVRITVVAVRPAAP